MKTQLKLSQQNAVLLAHYHSIATVANQIFGGKKGTSSGPPKTMGAGVKDLSAGHSSAESAVAAINAALLSG